MVAMLSCFPVWAAATMHCNDAGSLWRTVMSCISVATQCASQCGVAGKSQTIEMTDVAAEIVELLLQFIYGCLQQPNLTLPEVVALFEASDKYALASLHHQCTRLLTAHISFGNIFQLADLAQLHNCPRLLQVGYASPHLCTQQLPDSKVS